MEKEKLQFHFDAIAIGETMAMAEVSIHGDPVKLAYGLGSLMVGEVEVSGTFIMAMAVFCLDSGVPPDELYRNVVGYY